MYEIKLNTNCSKEEKTGTGPGSCGGSNYIDKSDNSKNFDNQNETFIFSGMKKSQYTIGNKTIPAYNNPNFVKPIGKTILVYHETNRKNIPSIIKNGLDANISGSVWFTSKRVFDDGLKEGYLHGDTVIAVLPVSEFQIDKNEQGIEVTNDIPVKYIKSYLPSISKEHR